MRGADPSRRTRHLVETDLPSSWAGPQLFVLLKNLWNKRDGTKGTAVDLGFIVYSQLVSF